MDFQNKALLVNFSAVRIAGQGVILTEPKSAHSRRRVSLPPSAVMLLAGLKVKLRNKLEEEGKQWDESAFIFPGTKGWILNPDTITHAFKKVVRQLGLPNVRFHDLRHTHATMMLKGNVHPKVVSERLGHASITITLDTYSHLLPSMQEHAALAFEGIMQGVAVAEPTLSGTDVAKMSPTVDFAGANRV